jgi:hypothetical protein
VRFRTLGGCRLAGVGRDEDELMIGDIGVEPLTMAVEWWSGYGLDSGMFNVDIIERNDTLIIYTYTHTLLTAHAAHTTPILKHTIHPNHPDPKPRQSSAHSPITVHTAPFCQPAT